MLRALLVLCLVSIGAPGLAQEYQSKDLAEAASEWRRELIERIPANKRQPAMIAGWRRMAESELMVGMSSGPTRSMTASRSRTSSSKCWVR